MIKKYKLVNNEHGVEIGVWKENQFNFVPFAPANTDYQLYLKWLDGYEEINGEWIKTSDANTPLPAD